MTADHRRMRESLGAWVLGGLDGEQRREVEAHLDDCDDCAAEVAVLSSLPGLLQRLDQQEATEGLLIPSDDLRDCLLAHVEVSEATLRHRLRQWQVGAAVAAVVAVLAVVAGFSLLDDGRPAESDRVVAAAAPVAPSAADTTGQVAALAWEWGTTVELDVTALPSRETYVLWAVADDGRRQQAGTWGATRSRGARVRGASAIQRDHLDRVEITDVDGEVLVAFDF